MPSVTRAIEVSHVTHAMSRVLYYCTSSVYLCWLKTINFNYPCIVTVTMELKAGFHTPVNRTHNSARCLAMYGHHCSQTISAFAIKACMLATKSHMLNFFEACDCNHWQPIMQDTKRFSVLQKKKKSNAQNKKLTTFGKSLFPTRYRMCYAIYIPPNTKDLAINLTMVAYGNRQKVIAFARANNSDLLRALNYLMKTRQ